MKNVLTILAAALFLSSAVVRGDEPAKTVVGNWQGTLDLGQVKLRSVFLVTEAAGGGLTATMYSPDQSPHGIPVKSVTVNGTSLQIDVPAINGTYAGTLNAAVTAATGQWTQNGQSFPLELAKVAGNEIGPSPENLSPADVVANQEAAQKVAGTWNGTLANGGAGLRLRVNIGKTAAGGAKGTIDSLDQNANGIPISAITLKDGKVRFEARGIGGVYEGTLAAENDTLSGQWQQAGHTMPLDLQKAKPE